LDNQKYEIDDLDFYSDEQLDYLCETLDIVYFEATYSVLQ